MGGERLPRDQQSPRYQFAMDTGAALNDNDYSGWIKVWQNPNINQQFEGGSYGPDDKGLTCFGTQSEPNKRIRDADVIHCSYAMGELLKDPSKPLPIKRNGDVLSFPWYRGCQIQVEYLQDWHDSCVVSQAEVAAATGLINFNCLKEMWAHGHTRFGVKGRHTLKTVEPCQANVVVSGGPGNGGQINCGSNCKLAAEKELSSLSALDRNLLLNFAENNSSSGVEFGEPLDPEWPELPYDENHPGYRGELPSQQARLQQALRDRL
jgi:hypothetical protein